MEFDRIRQHAAEAVGTGVLVATVVGSGIMAENLADDSAVALLGNTIATGAILVVLITVLGPVSGAHLNPAVTLAFAVRRDIRPAKAATFASVQIIGGVIGTVVAHLMFEQSPLQLAETARSGPAQWFAEVVATFGLVATILVGLRFRPMAVPWLVGLYISAAYWFTASTSFANPAVTIARSLSDTFSGIRPADVPGFLSAQMIGAVLAALSVGWLLREAADRARGQPD